MIGRILRSLAGLVGVVTALVGIPVALWMLGGNPLPSTISFDAFRTALFTPDDGQLLIRLVTWVGWLAWTGEGHFLSGSAADTWLLLGCGPITAVPLMLYAHAAKRMRLSTIGVLQYIAPTLVTVTAVLILGERFGPARMIAFPMIWAALVIYTASMFWQARRARAETPVEAG